MRGSSAALSATTCSVGPCSTSTSSAASRSVPRARSPRRRTVHRFRCPRSTHRGASCWTAARTVDFTPVHGTIESDLARRDFTINAIARPLDGGEDVDPSGGREDLQLRECAPFRSRSSTTTLCGSLRAVRLERELDFRLAPLTEQLVRAQAPLIRQAAGERILAELERLDPAGTGAWTSSGSSSSSAATSMHGSTATTRRATASSPRSARSPAATRSRASSTGTCRSFCGRSR